MISSCVRLALAGWFALAVSGSAIAGEVNPNSLAAAEAFTLGSADLKAGGFASALAHLERALALERHPTTAIHHRVLSTANLGEEHLAAGRPAEARATLERSRSEFIEFIAEFGQTTEFGKDAQDAQKQVLALEPLILEAKAGELRAEGDAHVAASRLSDAIERYEASRQGYHELVVAYPDRADHFGAPIGELDGVIADLRVRMAPPPVAPEAIPPKLPPVRERPYATAGAVTIGAGVVALGTGLYFLIDAADLRASVNDAADDTGFIDSMTQKRAQSISDEADRGALVGAIATVLGGVAIVGGTILVMVEVERPSDGRVDVTVSPIAGGAFVMARGGF